MSESSCSLYNMPLHWNKQYDETSEESSAPSCRLDELKAAQFAVSSMKL